MAAKTQETVHFKARTHKTFREDVVVCTNGVIRLVGKFRKKCTYFIWGSVVDKVLAFERFSNVVHKASSFAVSSDLSTFWRKIFTG